MPTRLASAAGFAVLGLVSMFTSGIMLNASAPSDLRRHVLAPVASAAYPLGVVLLVCSVILFGIHHWMKAKEDHELWVRSLDRQVPPRDR